jgi:hypothetical protein
MPVPQPSLSPADSPPAPGGRAVVPFLLRAGRIAIALALFGVAIGALALASYSGAVPAAHKDFISYWAAGQLLVHHANPYDSAAVLQLEKAEGFPYAEPLIMRNPPYSLVLALPLGLFRSQTALVIWSVAIVAALMVSVRLLWSLYGHPQNRIHMLVYVFVPVLASMQLGQTSPFLFLGLILFLYFHERKPFWSGVALPLLFIKPHLLLVFGLVLAAWIWKRRAWPILGGAAVSLAASMCIVVWCDPHVWSHFVPVLRGASNEVVLIPTVSSLVRHWVFRNAAWAQYLPAFIASFWAVWYYRKHRDRWDWMIHGAPLLLVSLWAAPYSWLCDEVLAAPALLRTLYLSGHRKRLLIVLALLNGFAFVVRFFFDIPLSSGIFVWTTSAWLLCYLFGAR